MKTDHLLLDPPSMNISMKIMDILCFTIKWLENGYVPCVLLQKPSNRSMNYQYLPLSILQKTSNRIINFLHEFIFLDQQTYCTAWNRAVNHNRSHSIKSSINKHLNENNGYSVFYTILWVNVSLFARIMSQTLNITWVKQIPGIEMSRFVIDWTYH